MGYIDFLALMSGARLMLSDSGGIQEETCILGVPCVVLRENTERPVTLRSGYHALAGTDTAKIILFAEKYLSNTRPRPFEIELWDGKAAERIVNVLEGLSAMKQGFVNVAIEAAAAAGNRVLAAELEGIPATVRNGAAADAENAAAPEKPS